MTVGVGSSYCDDVRVVLVVMVVHIIARSAAIPGRDDDADTKSTTAGGDIVLNSRLRRGEGRREEIVSIGGCIAPTHVGDVHATAEDMIECIRVLTGATVRAISNAKAGDAGIVGNTDTAGPITGRADDAHNGGAVPVGDGIAERRG